MSPRQHEATKAWPEHREGENQTDRLTSCFLASFGIAGSRRYFPIGCGAAFILGVVAASIVLGASTLGGVIIYGFGIGLVGSVGLYVILTVADRRM